MSHCPTLQHMELPNCQMSEFEVKKNGVACAQSSQIYQTKPKKLDFSKNLKLCHLEALLWPARLLYSSIERPILFPKYPILKSA